MTDLEKLRARIDEADEEILALIARRQELVAQAAKVKCASRDAAWSSERESYLANSREGMAARLGLPKGLASDLVRRILRESYQSSGIGAYPRLLETDGDVVIIGGNGGMGKIFTRYFEASGYKVISFGHRGWDQAAEHFKNAKIVMVTVPIDITEKILDQAAPYLREDMLLCDLTSVKGPVVRKMLSVHRGPVIGLHPMFGPDVPNLVKQVVVTVSARFPERTAFLRKQLALWGARVTECGADEHDKAMSIIQALRHFTTYAYGVFLASLHPDLHRILELSSPIYRLELMLVGRLFAQDPRLYADIIMSSQRNRDLVSSYMEALKPELDVILKSDAAAFEQRFLKAREYFGPYAERFLKESGSLLAKLQDER